MAEAELAQASNNEMGSQQEGDADSLVSVELETRAEGKETRKSARSESKDLCVRLKCTIENLSMTHASFNDEMNSVDSKPELVRLQAMLNELNQGLAHVISLHDELKTALGSVEPDHKLVKEIDRVCSDNRTIEEKVSNCVNELTVRPKHGVVTSDHVADSSSQNKTQSVTVGLSTPTTIDSTLATTATMQQTNNSDPQSVTAGNKDPAVAVTKPTHTPQSATANGQVQSGANTNIPYTGHDNTANLDRPPDPNLANTQARPESHHSHRSSNHRSVSYRSSSSRRTSSSRASQSLRLKQAEAAAAEVTKAAQLNAEIETQKLQAESLKLQSKATEIKMRADLEAARKAHAIYAQAIAEEEGEQLMRPPSRMGDAQLPVYPAETEYRPTAQQKAPQPVEQISGQMADTTTPNQTRVIYDQTPFPHVTIPESSPAHSVPFSNQALADSLASAINSIRMKPAEPPIFYGDPLHYIDWKVTFEGLVESGRKSPLERLTLLQQYIGGKAKDAVASLFRIGTEEAYQDAKKKLDRRFGRPEVISEAFRTRLEKWQRINEGDGEGLEKLTDFLESCQTAMRTVRELSCLGDRRENAKILEKLPLSVGRRWVTKATQVEKRTERFPTFKDFCRFMAEESDIATNPLARALSNRTQQSNNTTNQKSNNKTNEKKTNSLNTGVSDSNNDSPRPKPTPNKLCLKCSMANHMTSDCNQLAKLPRDQQLEFIKTNGLCFGCLMKGHMSNDCTKRAMCRKTGCGQTHPTIYHDYIMSKRSETATGNQNDKSGNANKNQAVDNSENTNKVEPKQANTQNERSVNGNTVSSGKQVMSWVIPVHVSHESDPECEILVNALLDSGSDTTFITDDTLNKLPGHVVKSNVNLKMATLTETEGKKTQRKEIGGLRIRGFNYAKIVKLPLVCSQSRVPTNPRHIPTSLSVQEWPHLRRLADELMPASGQDLEVGILIGGNVPQAFMPRDQIIASDHEPWAKLTDLGWCIMGNTSTDDLPELVTVSRAVSLPLEKYCVSFRCHTDDRDHISAKLLDILQQDFSTSEDDNLCAISTDDKTFIRTLEQQIHKDTEGYVTMPLPFKRLPPPNASRRMAESRFKHLQEKLKDPTYANHYKGFMQKVLDEGEAELVPSDEVSEADAWYIPILESTIPKSLVKSG